MKKTTIVVLYLLLLAQVSSQLCESHEYIDLVADPPRCSECSYECLTCSDGDTCDECANPNAYLNSSNGQCEYCDGGYLDLDTNACQSCHASCTSGFCLDATESGCLTCPDGQFYDLDTYTCVDTCPGGSSAITVSNHPALSADYSYCRGKEILQPEGMTVYVDSSTFALFELGTEMYPYKTLERASVEIFNYVYSPMTIKMKSGTKSSIYVKNHRPLVFLHHTITLESTDPLEMGEILVNTELLAEDDNISFSKFNIMQDAVYDIDGKLASGEITNTQDNLIDLNTGIVLIDSEFTVDGIHFTSDIALNIFTLDTEFIHTITIMNCYFTNIGSIFDSDKPVNLSMHDNVIDMQMAAKAVSFHSECTADVTNRETFDFYDNTIINSSTMEYTNEEIIFVMGPFDITIRNNIIKTGSYDTYYPIRISQSDSCFGFFDTDEAMTVEMNTFSDVMIISNIGFQFDLTEEVNMHIDNNQFMNSLCKGTIVKVQSLVETDVYISGLAIEGVTFMDDVAIVHIDTFGSIYFSDAVITDVAGASMSLLQGDNFQMYSASDCVFKDSVMTGSRTIFYTSSSSPMAQIDIRGNIIDNVMSGEGFYNFEPGLQCDSLTVTQNSVSNQRFLAYHPYAFNLEANSFTIVDNHFESFSPNVSGAGTFLYIVDLYVGNNEAPSVFKDNIFINISMGLLYLANMTKIGNLSTPSITVSGMSLRFVYCFLYNSFIMIGMMHIPDQLYFGLINFDLQDSNTIFSGIFLFFANMGDIELKDSIVKNVDNKVTVVGQVSHRTNQQTYFNNVRFETFTYEQQAPLNIMRKTTTFFADCVFEGLYINNEAVMTIQDVLVEMEGVLFNNCYSPNGIIMLEALSDLTCVDCIFTNNFSITGGILKGINDSVFDFSECLIENNRGLSNPILVMSELSTKVSSLNRCILRNNVQFSPLEFKALVLDGQVPEFGTHWGEKFIVVINDFLDQYDRLEKGIKSALNVSKSFLRLQDCEIINQSDFLTALSISVIDILGSTFSDIDLGPYNIVMVFQSQATIQDNTFITVNGIEFKQYMFSANFQADLTLENNDITDIDGSIIQAIKQSTVIIIGDTWSDVMTMNSVVDLEQCHFHIQGLTTTSLMTSGSNVFKLNNSDDLVLDQLIIDGFDKIAISMEVSTLQLTNSEIKNGSDMAHGIYAHSSTVSVSGSTFDSIETMDDGAGISVVDSTLNVMECIFKNNKAQSGAGINIRCSEMCSNTLTLTSFLNNEAQEKGGAYYYDYSIPETDGLIFEGNEAPYGANVASYAKTLRIVEPIQTLFGDLPTVEAVSGQQYDKDIIIEILDIDDQVMVLDSQSVVQLMVSQTETKDILVKGQIRAVAQNGIFIFNGVEFTISPYSGVGNFEFTASAINTPKLQETIGEEADMKFEIGVRSRDCMSGEFLFDETSCLFCEPGTYNFETNADKCIDCPLNVFCPGRDVLVVDAGFWRSDNTSSSIYECMEPLACIGGDGSKTSQDSGVLCAEGYFHNLCHECIFTETEQYSRSGKHGCVKCGNQTENFLKIVGVSLIIIVFVAILIFINLRKSKDSPISILMRIMTNYIQVVGTAASFNLSWPEELATFQDTFTIVNESSTSIFSIDCFLSAASLPPGGSNVFVKALFALSLPLGGLLVFALVYGLPVIGSRDIAKYKRRIIVSMISFMFLVHPTITDIAFGLFNCFQIDVPYLQSDMRIQCWTGEHLTWSLGVGGVCILLWTIGAPVFAFFILYKNKTRLNEESMLYRYRMLYQGTRNKVFYWEYVNVARKVILIAINTFMSLAHPQLRASLAVFVLFIHLKLQEVLKPYKVPIFNNIEYREAISSTISLYGGMLFIHPDLNFTSKSVLAVIVIIVNVNYFSLWIYTMLSHFEQMKYGRLAKVKILCIPFTCKRRAILDKQIEESRSIIEATSLQNSRKNSQEPTQLMDGHPQDQSTSIQQMQPQYYVSYLDGKQMNGIDSSSRMELMNNQEAPLNYKKKGAGKRKKKSNKLKNLFNPNDKQAYPMEELKEEPDDKFYQMGAKSPNKQSKKKITVESEGDGSIQPFGDDESQNFKEFDEDDYKMRVAVQKEVGGPKIDSRNKGPPTASKQYYEDDTAMREKETGFVKSTTRGNEESKKMPKSNRTKRKK